MTEKKYPSDNQERFMLRLPDGMRDLIAATAKANNRSMNAEIVAQLQKAFEPPSQDDLDANYRLGFLAASVASAVETLKTALAALKQDNISSPAVKLVETVEKLLSTVFSLDPKDKARHPEIFSILSERQKLITVSPESRNDIKPSGQLEDSKP